MNDAYNAVITGYNWLLILLITCTEVTNNVVSVDMHLLVTCSVLP